MRRLVALLGLLALGLGLLPAGQAGEVLDGPVIIRGRTAGELRLFEDPANGVNWARFLAPNSLGSDVTITLPSASGTLMLGGEGADGTVLRGAGIGVAPIWGQVRLSGATVDVTGVPTGLLLGNGTSVAAYAGASCTNQFPRSLNASGAATCATVSLTADITGILPYANGGTNASTSWTQGSIFFGAASAFAQDNSNLFWDDSGDNLRLFGGAVGTSGQKVLTLGISGSEPSTKPADSVQILVRDLSGAGTASLTIFDEAGGRIRIGSTNTTDTMVELTSQAGATMRYRTGSGEGAFESNDVMAFRGSGGTIRLWLDDSENVGLGSAASFGSSCISCVSIPIGTAPTTSPADIAQIYVRDISGAGTATAHHRDEAGNITPLGHLTATTTYDAPSIAAGAETNTTITVTGAGVGMPAICGLTTLTTQDLHMTAVVSAADTVRVLLGNPTGGAIDLASGTLRCSVFRY